MKKLILFLFLISCFAFTSPSLIFAEGHTFEKVFGKIDPPSALQGVGRGAEGINKVLNVFVNIIYTVAIIAVLFMIVFGALQWITSGGDKEAVKSARQRITWAIIGITLLALTFVILKTLGDILGFKFFSV